MHELTESELYLYFYKDILTDDKTKKEVDFIKFNCNLSDGDSLLDMPCFFGRHALMMASEISSINIVAADINPQYIFLAKKTASEQNLSNIEFLQLDMRKINFKKAFNCALCMYTSFGYFSDNENLRVLKKYRECLSENGIFVLDVINPSIFTEGAFTFAKKGNDMILDVTKKNIDSGFWNINRKYIFKSKTYEFDYMLRLYSKQELIKSLSDVGFNELKIYGDFDCSEYTSESPRILILAK